MSDPRETPSPSTSTPRRRFLKQAAIVTAIAGLATGFGVRAFAQAGGHGAWPGGHRGGFMGMPGDPAMMEGHLERMLKHLYVEIDASDAQKQQLDPIVKGAARDLVPLRARLQDVRRQAVQILSQDSVDRGALEALRADQVRVMDELSKRCVQALADVADVLTPEQKKQLAERLGRGHGHRG